MHVTHPWPNIIIGLRRRFAKKSIWMMQIPQDAAGRRINILHKCAHSCGIRELSARLN